MPNIPTYRSNRPKSTNIGQAPLNPSVANVAGQAVGQGFAAGARAEMRGLQQLGNSLEMLGKQMDDIQTAEDTSKGLAEYQNEINNYNLSLKDKRPEDYLEKDVNGQYILPQDLQARINGIFNGKTGRSQRLLQNKFMLLNESNRAEIAVQMARSKATQITAEFDRLATAHAANPDRELGLSATEDYISGATQVIGTEAAKELRTQRDIIFEKEDILTAIDIAGKTLNADDVKKATDMIDKNKYFQDQDSQDKFENRLASAMRRTQERNSGFKYAVDNEVSRAIIDTVYKEDGNFDNLPDTDDTKQFKSIIQERYINGSLNTPVPGSEGNFEQLKDHVLSGGEYSDTKLLDYFTAMSIDQMKEIDELNRENVNIRKYRSYTELSGAVKRVRSGYDGTRRMIEMNRKGLGTKNADTLLANMDSNQDAFTKQIRNKLSLPSSEATMSDVHETITKHFEGTEKGVLEPNFTLAPWGWFGANKLFKGDVHDFEDDLEEPPMINGSPMPMADFKRARVDAMIKLLNLQDPDAIEHIQEAMDEGWLEGLYE